jgi:hypothetical protein
MKNTKNKIPFKSNNEPELANFDDTKAEGEKDQKW